MDFCFSKLSFSKLSLWIIRRRFIIFFCFRFFNLWNFLKRNLKFIVKKFLRQSKSFWIKYSFVFKFFIRWSFVSILFFKFWGTIPYVFGLSSQIVFVLIIAFIFWFCILIFGVFLAVFFFIENLVPQGRPLGLGSFIAIVEVISNLIRPLTLTLRLSIKITTGHIFISLIRGGIVSLVLTRQFLFRIFLGLILSFYFLFEFLVCSIQAVVFSLLLIQYGKEISI